MELRRLRYFVAVAEELNFSRAAERLHISQQGLSSQIGQLESELGVLLLTRTTRRVGLTPVGRVFLDKARIAIAATDDAFASARWAAAAPDGPLRLFYVFQVPRIAERLVARLRERHPDVNVFTSMLYEAAALEGLRSGALDAGFTWWRTDFEGLESVVVDREEIVGVVREDHRLAGAERFAVAELAGDPVVLFQREHHRRAYDAIRGHLSRHVDGPLVVDHADFSLEFSQARMIEDIRRPNQWSLAIRRGFERARIPGVVAAALDPPLHAEVMLVWRPPASPAVRAFADAARQPAERPRAA